MKRTILYIDGVITEYAFVPESDLVLSKSAFIAQIQLQNGHDAQVYLPRNGMPILLVATAKDAMSSPVLPEYEDLNHMCEEQSYSKYGQTFTISDALLRDGICPYTKIHDITKKLTKNIEKSNTLVMIDENIRTGFDT